MNHDEYWQFCLDAGLDIKAGNFDNHVGIRMTYSDYLQLMLNAALDIKEGNFNNHIGICGNIESKVTNAWDVEFPDYVPSDDDELIMNSWQILSRAFCTWPEFSGDRDYPIKDPHGIDTPYNVYARSHKWIGEYGALRFELLDHVIDFLKKEIEKEALYELQ